VLERAYLDPALLEPALPSIGVPALLPQVRPVHSVVHVDVYVPGCPPPADSIFQILTGLLTGQTPNVSSLTRFGR
jgi:NAD-reducing hydrogenase small subunit